MNMKKILIYVALMLILTTSAFAYGGAFGSVSVYVNKNTITRDSGNIIKTINFNAKNNIEKTFNTGIIKKVELNFNGYQYGSLYLYEITKENSKDIYNQGDFVKLFRFSSSVDFNLAKMTFDVDKNKNYKLLHLKDNKWIEENFINGVAEIKDFSYFVLVEDGTHKIQTTTTKPSTTTTIATTIATTTTTTTTTSSISATTLDEDEVTLNIEVSETPQAELSVEFGEKTQEPINKTKTALLILLIFVSLCLLVVLVELKKRKKTKNKKD